MQWLGAPDDTICATFFTSVSLSHKSKQCPTLNWFKSEKKPIKRKPDAFSEMQKKKTELQSLSGGGIYHKKYDGNYDKRVENAGTKTGRFNNWLRQ